MHNAMIETMRTDALHDLYAGYVTPLDREILSDMPLPSDMVDPFASQDADPLSVMNLTYVSLTGWIADARKEKYYSERFVSLSKLVMKGVAIMGRGLVTLHQRGEELSAAPMQIEDLISVGSYHFRKSYLGVVQFSAKHPEIGERLLINQLGWSTTLLRLYKTKEKLNKKSEIRNKKSDSGAKIEDQESRLNENERTLPNEEGSIQNEAMPNGNPDNSSFLLHNSSFDKASSLNAVSALFEPGAFSGARAYSSLVRNQKYAGGKVRAEEKSLPQETKPAPAENQAKLSEETVASEVSGNEKKEPEDKEIKLIEVQNGNEISGNLETKRKQTTLIKKYEEQDHEEIKNNEPVSRKKEQTEKPDEQDEDPSPDDGTPGYLKILKNVYARSGPSETGSLTFTFDEIVYLAFDPDFRQIYPESAAEMRRMLDRIDSG